MHNIHIPEKLNTDRKRLRLTYLLDIVPIELVPIIGVLQHALMNQGKGKIK